MTSHGTEFDELELLRREARAIGMPGPITPTSVGITPQTADDVLARIRARDTGPSRAVKCRRVTVRILAIAAAAAAIVVLITAPWQQPPATAADPPVLDFEFANAHNIAYAPGEDARATLLALARTADAQPPIARNGTTQYQLTDNWYASLSDQEEAELIPKIRHSWLRADGSMRVREISGTPLSPDGRVLAKKAKAGVRIANETYPPNDVPSSLIDDLERDDDKIRTAIMDSAQCEVRTPGPARTSCLYLEIVSFHSQFVIPPDISAHFWRILADEPSLRLLGSVTDRVGRAGIGISLISEDAPQFRQVIIISPKTGQLIGTEDILIKDSPDDGVKAPAIYSFTAILKSEYTTAIGPTD